MKRKALLLLAIFMVTLFGVLYIRSVSVKADINEVGFYVPDPYVGEDVASYTRRVRLDDKWSAYYEVIYGDPNQPYVTTVDEDGVPEKFVAGNVYWVFVYLKKKAPLNDYVFWDMTHNGEGDPFETDQPGIFGVGFPVTAIEKRFKITVNYTDHPSDVLELLPGTKGYVSPPEFPNMVFDHFEAQGVTPSDGSYNGARFNYVMPLNDVVINVVYRKPGQVTIKWFRHKPTEKNAEYGPTYLKEDSEKQLASYTANPGQTISYDASDDEGELEYFDYWSAEGMTLTEAQKKNPKLNVTYPGGNVTLTAHYQVKLHVHVAALHEYELADSEIVYTHYYKPGETVSFSYNDFMDRIYEIGTDKFEEWLDGYYFDHFELIYGPDVPEDQDNKTEVEFTMGENSAYFRAVYLKYPTLKLVANYPEHTHTSDGTVHKGHSDVIIEEAVQPGSGYTLLLAAVRFHDYTYVPGEWTSEDLEISAEDAKKEKLTFNMPFHDVTVTVDCKPKGWYDVRVVLPDGSDERYFRKPANRGQKFTEENILEKLTWHGKKYKLMYWESDDITEKCDPDDPAKLSFQFPDDEKDVTIRLHYEPDNPELHIIGRFHFGATGDYSVCEEELDIPYEWVDVDKPTIYIPDATYWYKGRKFHMFLYSMERAESMDTDLSKDDATCVLDHYGEDNRTRFIIDYMEYIVGTNLSEDGLQKEETYMISGEYPFTMLISEGESARNYRWKAKGVKLTNRQKRSQTIYLRAPETDFTITVVKVTKRRIFAATGGIVVVGGTLGLLGWKKKLSFPKRKGRTNTR